MITEVKPEEKGIETDEVEEKKVKKKVRSKEKDKSKKSKKKDKELIHRDERIIWEKDEKEEKTKERIKHKLKIIKLDLN